MSSFAFLSDAFPSYENTNDVKTTSLYEDFNVPSHSVGVPAKPHADSDLQIENFKDYNLPLTKTKDVPQPFDQSDDYFKLLSEMSPQNTQQISQQQAPQQNECVQYSKHLDECKNCRTRLEQIFKKMFSGTTTTSTKPWYIDTALLLLIGIFIVFVLDAFVRLGKYLQK